MAGTHLQIETERLILRPPGSQDFDGWAQLMGDEEASHFIGGPLDERGAWGNLALMAGAWTLDGFSNFSVIEKSSGRWIGRAGPWSPPGWPGHEIGWAFLRGVWGKGYAHEASLAAMKWSAATLGWREIVHIIHPENSRSIALAQRLGSKFLHPLQAGFLSSPVPLLLFGQSL